ncbi:MAG: hypothetical protein KAI66_21180, partial [Lentisphaeria bacterium]|nr:hypothetical protein [Lentisphaeria bacterium]
RMPTYDMMCESCGRRRNDCRVDEYLDSTMTTPLRSPCRCGSNAWRHGVSLTADGNSAWAAQCRGGIKRGHGVANSPERMD